ncbi:MAG: adenosine deaminase [FCB group bacterium]|nr:adenosine deaminase [FCB group bacterium]
MNTTSQTTPEDLRSWLEAMPKTELHIHLEGAVPPDALWDLIRKYGGDPIVKDPADLRARFQYTDFANFIDMWAWKNSFLREYEDFQFISEVIAENLADQNIRYAEIFYSPGDFDRHGLDPRELTVAIRKGFERQSHRITLNLIADLVRDFGPARGAIWLEQIAEVKDRGVVGIGLGGSEQAFPAEPYRQVFERARTLGFHTTAHAGEAAGAESILAALTELKTERIGHGLKAASNPALLTRLADMKIPLEVCPISNVRTGCIARLEDHPIRQFLQRGIIVTVSTDDPEMFNTNLAFEFESLHSVLGLTLQELVSLAFNSINAAWCSDEQKKHLQSELKHFIS